MEDFYKAIVVSDMFTDGASYSTGWFLNTVDLGGEY